MADVGGQNTIAQVQGRRADQQVFKGYATIVTAESTVSTSP